MDADRDTPEGDELEVLSLVVDAYEESQYPIDDPDPINFLKDVMEFRGYVQKDLAQLLNSRPRASDPIGTYLTFFASTNIFLYTSILWKFLELYSFI
jgi:antitoxin component HigA of HigAB toxin-antitoxin module